MTNSSKATKDTTASKIVEQFDRLKAGAVRRQTIREIEAQASSSTTPPQGQLDEKNFEGKGYKLEDNTHEEVEGWSDGKQKTLDFLQISADRGINLNTDQLMALKKEKKQWLWGRLAYFVKKAADKEKQGIIKVKSIVVDERGDKQKVVCWGDVMIDKNLSISTLHVEIIEKLIDGLLKDYKAFLTYKDVALFNTMLSINAVGIKEGDSVVLHLHDPDSPAWRAFGELSQKKTQAWLENAETEEVHDKQKSTSATS